ncbi:MAG TPA: hypothetical protein VFZ14_08660 [Burkholderiales bacterium]|nr:hypothetical protein [Burkholderiales bacterium]
MNRYEPRTSRIFAGFAAVALTAATIALTVMVPAEVDAQHRDALAAASGGEDHVYANAGPLTTSIDVIAYRGKRGAPIIQSRAHLRSGRAS